MEVIKKKDLIIVKINNVSSWKCITFFNGLIILIILILFVFIFNFKNIFLLLAFIVFFILSSLDLKYSFYANEEMIIKKKK